MGDNSKKPSESSDNNDPLGHINSAVFMNAGKGGIQSAMGIQNAYEQILADGQPTMRGHKVEGILPVCRACGHKNGVGAEHCGQCGKTL